LFSVLLEKRRRGFAAAGDPFYRLPTSSFEVNPVVPEY
jgi:hypothetical protein